MLPAEDLDEPTMAQVNSAPHRRRCGRCRQFGHNRTYCPHSDLEADRLTAEHNALVRHNRHLERQRTEEAMAFHAPFDRQAGITVEHRAWSLEFERRYALEERVVELQSVVESLSERPDRPQGPSKLAVKMQEIIFENADKIPDGVYKQLMDTLMVSE